MPLGRGLCGPRRPAWDCSGVHFGVTTCARLPRQFGVLPWCTCRVCLPDPAAAASQAGPRVTPGPQAPALGTGHLVASTPPTPSFANRSPSRWAPAAQGGRPARVFQGSASGSAELFRGTGTYYLPSSPSVSAVAAFWEPGRRPSLPEVVAEEMSHRGDLGEVTRVVRGPQPAAGSRGLWAGPAFLSGWGAGFSLPPKRDTEAGAEGHRGSVEAGGSAVSPQSPLPLASLG